MNSTYVTLPALIFANFVPWSRLKQYWVYVAIGATSLLMAAGENSFLWTIVTTLVPPLKFSRFPSSDYRGFVAISIIFFSLVGLEAIVKKDLSWPSMLSRIMFVLLWFSQGVYSVYHDLHSQYAVLAALVATGTILMLLYSWKRQSGFSRVVLTGSLLLILVDGARVLPDMNTWRDPRISSLYSKNDWPYMTNGELVNNSIFQNLPRRRPPRRPNPLPHHLNWGGYMDGRFMMGDLGAGLLQVMGTVGSNSLYQEYMQMEWLPLFMNPDLPKSGTNQVSLPDSELAGYLKAWKYADSGYVRQTLYGINDITYEVSLSDPRLMVENEIYFPGWTARVVFPDRQWQIEALAVNGVFRAWVLPAGDYRMEAHFEFPNIWIYRSVSLLALIVWLTIVEFYLIRQAGRLTGVPLLDHGHHTAT